MIIRYFRPYLFVDTNSLKSKNELATSIVNSSVSCEKKTSKIKAQKNGEQGRGKLFSIIDDHTS